MAADLESSCTSKKRYPSEDVARGSAIQLWYAHRVQMRAYACNACNGWHLTTAAAEMMRPGWREPKMSERESARRRRAKPRRHR